MLLPLTENDGAPVMVAVTPPGNDPLSPLMSALAFSNGN